MRSQEHIKLFRDGMRSGMVFAGTMLEELESPKIIKVLEGSGYDFFIIDCEHGTYNPGEVSDMVMSADFCRIMPFARVAEIRKEAFLKILDTGVAGIMVPAIKSADEAREAVRLARFKPEGCRGYSTFKYFSNYSARHPSVILDEANRSTILIMQIETMEAVADIEEITKVAGIDAVIVGPGDLSLSYGLPGRPRDPVVVSAIEKVMDAAKNNGLGAGIHCGRLEDLLFWKEKGMNILMWSSPLAMIYNSSVDSLRSLKGGII